MSMSLGENPYWVFIGFLYAWIAADIARRFRKVFDPKLQAKHGSIISHLVLASFVVGTSWIDWSRAFLNGEITAPREVISLGALMVIIDFMILTMYFNFVSVVGKVRQSKVGPSQHCQEYASFWVVLILTMYVVWQGLLSFIVHMADASNTNWVDNPPKTYPFWPESWGTFLCAALAGLIFYLQKKGRLRRLVQSDFCLLFLILFFRALNQMSHADKQSILRQIWPQTGGHRLGIIAFTFLITFFAFAWSADRDKSQKEPPPEDQAQPTSAARDEVTINILID